MTTRVSGGKLGAMPAYVPKQNEGTVHIQAQPGPQRLAEARMEQQEALGGSWG